MMTEGRRPLIAGNWKKNGLKASLGELGAIAQGAAAVWRKADLLICPPATLLFLAASEVVGSKVAIGAQDCHPAASGAGQHAVCRMARGHPRAAAIGGGSLL